MALLNKQNETTLLVVAGVIVAYVGYKAYSGAKAVGKVVKETVTKDLNPAAKENVVNRTIGAPVNNLVEKVTGHGLGGTVFCLFNSDSPACNPELFEYATRYNIPYFAEGSTDINPKLQKRFDAEAAMIL